MKVVTEGSNNTLRKLTPCQHHNSGVHFTSFLHVIQTHTNVRVSDFFTSVATPPFSYSEKVDVSQMLNE